MTRAERIFRSSWVWYLLLCLPPVGVLLAAMGNEVSYLADPAKYTLEYFGKTAVVLLVIVLAVTPLRRLFPKSRIMRLLAGKRRPIGVSVFVYAFFHFLIYLPYVGGWSGFVEDWSKPFILTGVVALVLLLVLAITSNNRSVRWLGAKRWKRIHLLVYPVLGLAMYHQAAQEKTGFGETAFYFGPIVLLEGIRLALWLKGKIGRQGVIRKEGIESV